MSGALARKRPLRYRVPKGLVAEPALVLVRNPEGSSSQSRRFGFAAMIAIIAHGLLALLGVAAPSLPTPKPVVAITQNVTIEKPKPPEVPPPLPPPEPPHQRPREARRAAEPPAAARAGKVIARAAEPSGPLDMTSFSLVQGTSEKYVGGFTARTGTADSAVTDPNATARGTAPPGPPSQARSAAPGRRDWACAWPEDEQAGDVRDVKVTIRVHVDRDGAPQSVDVLGGAAPTFALAARRCAMGETYRTALADSGQSISGTTPAFVVHFER